MHDVISRQAAIDAICLNNYHDITLVNGKPYTRGYRDGVLAKENDCIENIMNLPSAQPEIVRCKDCKYGEQDEVGRWFCSDLGCQIGDEDGSGFCADAERRTDG